MSGGPQPYKTLAGKAAGRVGLVSRASNRPGASRAHTGDCVVLLTIPQLTLLALVFFALGVGATFAGFILLLRIGPNDDAPD